MPSGGTHTLEYVATLSATTFYFGDTDWDCEVGQKMQLTFTGSGTSITYSSACLGSATDDTTDDDTTSSD